MPSSTTCPVPIEQRPLNEYRSLAESWYFRWATFDGFGYMQPIALLWLGSWIVSGPVSAASFWPTKHPIEFIFWAGAGACILPTIAVVRLYLGWTYIRKRLFATKVFYEESGWYDGQTWEKNPDMLDQDRLVAVYEVQPIVQRMEMTLLAIGLIFGCGTLGAIGWNAWL
jgi:Conserved in the green lineage and diatoms 27